MSSDSQYASSGLFKCFFRSKVESLTGIPGPRPSFPLGNLWDFRATSAHALLDRYASQYGDLVAFWLLGTPNLLINSPQLIEHVLSDHRDDYYKNNPTAAARPVIRRSVFLSNDEDWEFKRKNHPFLAEGVERYLEKLRSTSQHATEQYMSELQSSASSQRVEFFEELVKLSFRIFSLTVFGSHFDQQRYDDFNRLMREMTNRGGRPIAISLSPWFWASQKRWFNFIEAQIDQRSQIGDPAEVDIVPFLYANGGTKLSKSQLRDELSTAFTAGTRNVAVTVAATVFLCHRHPDVLQRLQAEVKSVLAAGQFDLFALNGMQYLDKVVKETMRLYPAVPFFIREVVPDKAVTLGDHTLPKGTQIFVSSWALHRNPKVWKDPDIFDPERFAVEIPASHYIPFGFGPRACVGADFTLVSSKAILVSLLSKYSIDVDAQATFDTTYFAGTIMPTEGLPVTIQSFD